MFFFWGGAAIHHQASTQEQYKEKLYTYTEFCFVLLLFAALMLARFRAETSH